MAEKPKKRGPGYPRKNSEAVVPKAQKKRRRTWQDEDEDDEGFDSPDADDDSDGDDSGESTPDDKPKKRGTGRPRKYPMVDKEVKPKRGPGRPRKHPSVEKEEPKHKKWQAAKVSPPYVEDEDDDESAAMKALEEKHKMRKQQHELDSEHLLDEVTKMAKAEKKVQQQMIDRLKNDIATLSALAEKEKKSRQREVERQVTERMREFESEQRKRDGADEEKQALKQHIKELEAQFASFKRSTGPDDVVVVSSAAPTAQSVSDSEACVQLTQANKLLDMYRLVTSTDIRLIEALDDDGQEADECTDVVCTTTDSAAGKQFEFELSVPASSSSMIEYLPSENPTTDLKIPSYLRQELSFKRAEMTKFMRAVLDAVIRTRKEHKAKGAADN